MVADIYFLYAPFIYLLHVDLETFGIFVQKKIIQRIKNVFSWNPFRFVCHYRFMDCEESSAGFVYSRNRTALCAAVHPGYWGVASQSCTRIWRWIWWNSSDAAGCDADLTYGSAENSLLRFPTEIQERFQVVWKNDNAEYLCFSYKNIPGNDPQIPGFEIMKTYRVDGMMLPQFITDQ